MVSEKAEDLKSYVLERSELAPANLPLMRGCRLWTKQAGFPFPTVRHSGKIYRVQRFAYLAYKGEDALTEEMHVYSTCGNGRCVAEDHLKVKIRFSKTTMARNDAAAADAAEAATPHEQRLVVSKTAGATEIVYLPPQFEALIKLIEKAETGPKTRNVYSSCLRQFFRWCVATGKAGISRDIVMEYRESIKPLKSASTVNLRITAIKALAKELKWAKLLSSDDYEAIAAVKAVPQAHRRDGTLKGTYKRWLTIEELRMLLALEVGISRKQRLKAQAVMHVLCFTGLRVTELCSLKWGQIGSASNRPALVDVLTKGEDGGKLQTFALPMPAYDALMFWAAECGVTKTSMTAKNPSDVNSVDGADAHKHVFDLSSNGVRVMLERVSVLLGIRLRPHDLRRSFARLSKHSGASLEEIQLALGHSNVATTKIYIGEETEDYSIVAGDKLASMAKNEEQPV